MKKQLLVYATLILAFILYNRFFQVEDARLNEIINILFASFLFLYISYVAMVALRKIKKASKK